MKYLMACFSLLVAFCAFGTKSPELTDLTKPFLLTHPGRFSIYLPSNPTTGYQWFVSDTHAPWLRVVSGRDLEPKASGAVGAPGMYVIDFNALPAGFVAPSITTVELVYMRPWELAGKKEMQVSIITHKSRDRSY